jgi:hypothetical protein
VTSIETRVSRLEAGSTAATARSIYELSRHDLLEIMGLSPTASQAEIDARTTELLGRAVTKEPTRGEP